MNYVLSFSPQVSDWAYMCLVAYMILSAFDDVCFSGFIAVMLYYVPVRLDMYVGSLACEPVVKIRQED